MSWKEKTDIFSGAQAEDSHKLPICGKRHRHHETFEKHYSTSPVMPNSTHQTLCLQKFTVSNSCESDTTESEILDMDSKKE